MTGFETALLVTAVAGTAVSTIGQIQQANAQKETAAYNATVARNNAIIARQNADAQAERQAREARIRAGANRAAAGGMGIRMEGSVLDVLEDNAMEEELDRLMILHQGEVRATGFEATGGLEDLRGSNVSYLGAAGTLLEGATQIAASSGFGASDEG